MIEQGDMIVNTEYYDKLIERANGCTECDELNQLASEAIASVKAQQEAALLQISSLVPILQLLKPPTSLTSLISWVKNYITTFLTPYLKPYATYAAQLTLMTAKMAELVVAMEGAASKMTSCSLSVDLSLPPLSLPDFEIPDPDAGDPAPAPTPTPTPTPTPAPEQPTQTAP